MSNTNPGGFNLDGILSTYNSPAKTLFAACMATVVDGIILTSILFHIYWYYSNFRKSDQWWIQAYVGVGTVLCLASITINASMVYEIAHHFGRPSETLRIEYYLLFTELTFGVFFSVPTSAFFSWRAWKVWLIPIFCVAVLGVLATSLPVLIVGFQFVDPSTGDISGFIKYGQRLEKFFPIWGSTCLGCDAVICVISVYYLLSAKASVFHSQSHIWNKLVSLTFESMLPPVLCLIVLVSTQRLQGSVTGDFRKVFITALSILYFHSLVHSLVSRSSVREMLNDTLKSSGIHDHSLPPPVSWSGETAGKEIIGEYGSGNTEPLPRTSDAFLAKQPALSPKPSSKLLAPVADIHDEWIMMRPKSSEEGLLETRDQVHLARHPWAAGEAV